jgi:hypothetical protein
MGYEVSWYIEGRVVKATFTGEMTIQETESASEMTAQYIQEGQPPSVHLIADTTQLERFPTNLNLLNRSSSKHLWQPRIGWTIVISTNSTTRFISGVITQVARVRFRMFPTLEEGLVFLADQDKTLLEYIKPQRSAALR